MCGSWLCQRDPSAAANVRFTPKPPTRSSAAKNDVAVFTWIHLLSFFYERTVWQGLCQPRVEVKGMLKRLESEELRVTVLAYKDAQSRQALPDCGQWHNTGDANAADIRRGRCQARHLREQPIFRHLPKYCRARSSTRFLKGGKTSRCARDDS
jgi:hypothetical protein